MPDFAVIKIISFEILCGETLMWGHLRWRKLMRLFPPCVSGVYGVHELLPRKDSPDGFLDGFADLHEIIIHGLRTEIPTGGSGPTVTIEQN